MNRLFYQFVIILFALSLPAFLNISAQKTMTDDEVYEMAVKEIENGATQEQLVTKLMQRGVQIEQIRRLRDKYEKQQNKDLLNSQSVLGTSKRTRVNNGDKRREEVLKRRRPNYEKDDPEFENYRKKNVENYTHELDFMFADSLDIYKDYFEDEEEDKIKIFGHDIFNNDKLTFETSMNIATPKDYVLGPGDEVFVDVYGASQRTITAIISPEGSIDIENFGPVNVGGLTVSAATNRLRSTLGQHYSNSTIRLTVGQTKTVSVQVMGAVNVPGTYTLSAFSSVFHALYMAGGISDIGTLRNIKVFRNNKLISTVDIYDYILNGKMTGDVHLKDNDIIIVGTYDCLVNIAGRIKRPMYYEMKNTESVETLLSYAGGFTGDAYKKAVRLIRKNGDRYSMFTIDEFERPNFKVVDGDSVSVDSTLEKFENMVIIKGAVHRPGMYQIGNNINSVRELVNKAEGLTPNAFASHAVLHRTKQDKTLQTISLDLKGIMDGSIADVPLQNEDVIYVLDTENKNKELTMSIFGEVQYPGTYDFSENTTISDFVIQAGGLKDAASTIKVDVSRRIRDPKATSTTEVLAKTYTFTLRDGLVVDNDSAFVLEPFDEVYIRTSPGYMPQQHITVVGEVAFAGEYTLNKKGQRLSDIIKNCGGLTPEAYAKGARLERKMTLEEKERQKALLRVAAGNDSIDLNKLELSDTRSIGINLDMAIQNPGNDEWDIVLEENDRLIVPQYRNTVSISGEVMYPTTVAYKSGSKLDYYINKSGGFSQNAKTGRVFAVNMNGTVTRVRSAKDILPGSEIVVPSKKKHNKMSMGELLSIGTMTASLGSIISVLLK